MATADPTHQHSEFHRGMVPDDQIAEGTPEVGFAPVWTDTDTREWQAVSGGGGDCDHEHVTEEFIAVGDTPEEFVLGNAPMYSRRVYLNGLRVTPSAVGGSGTSVEIDTEADDEVVVDYEAECGTVVPPGDGPLAFPGSDVEAPTGSNGNLIATIEATGPAILVITLADGIVGDDDYTYATNDLIQGFNGWDFPVAWNQSTAPSVDDPDTPGTYYLPIPVAGTWYIITGSSGFDADLTGLGSWQLVYPTGTPTDTLAFPGTDGSGSNEGNILATDTVTSPVAVFVTITADLADGYAIGALADSTDLWAFFATTPDVLPAGVYPIPLGNSSAASYTAINIDAFEWFDPTIYDAGMTNTGTYEIVVLPT